MIFSEKDGVLTAKSGYETIRIEAWGKGLRVRATQRAEFTGKDNALENRGKAKADIVVCDFGAVVKVGKLRCEVSRDGLLEFYYGEKRILKEYYRDWKGNNPHSPCQRVYARTYRPIRGTDDYELTLRFEAQDGEKIFGMGQYQQPNLDLKGCVLELAQRNSQASVPFYLSSLGYGFLWNSPAVGEAVFGANYTQFRADSADEFDYFVTAGDTPKEILKNYTAVVGRAPEFPYDALGLWQSKLRYRTEDELLSVAREYHRRGIPLDVIVIDFFHWPWQGDWKFDPEYWHDPKGMVEELKKMGTRCMVSIWPTVDKRSENYDEMRERGLLVRTDRGVVQTFDWQGDTCIYDATNPEARDFIWEKVKKNYYDYGVDVFWLDEAEPEFSVYDYDNYRYYTGPVIKCGNAYPMLHSKGFYEHQLEEGQKNIINLTRCAWVGSQKYGAAVWSGDIKGTFESLRDQLSAGLNMGIAGIPWWNTDTGGFFGSTNNEHFKELMVRWFQFSAFCPILRMHGDREPHDIPPLSNLDHGGGFCFTGGPNELWSFGDEAYRIMKKYLDVRLSMRDYIKSVMDEASLNGSPILRTMFYEFPNDGKCWDLRDQYMFGSKYLVAPVMYQGMTEREVYLPKGKWKNIESGEVYSGGVTVAVPAPLDVIPVFEKIK